MKHITEEYGQPCEQIESTCEEFFVLKEFLKRHGVEARLIIVKGDRCKWQIRNGYKDMVQLHKNNTISCNKIIEIVEADIKSGHWCR